MLRHVRGGARAAIELVVAAAVEFHLMTPPVLGRVAELMERYRNVPMDLVDAHLMCAAEDLNIAKIFTLDRRGFATYRARGRRALTLLPG